jgi:hypothetical protein
MNKNTRIDYASQGYQKSNWKPYKLDERSGTDLGPAFAELEETRLALGGGGLVLELLDFAAFGFSLLLELSDPHAVLGRAHVPVSHTRHLSVSLSSSSRVRSKK